MVDQSSSVGFAIGLRTCHSRNMGGLGRQNRYRQKYIMVKFLALSLARTIEPSISFTLTPSVAFRGSHSLEPPIFETNMSRGSRVLLKDSGKIFIVIHQSLGKRCYQLVYRGRKCCRNTLFHEFLVIFPMKVRKVHQNALLRCRLYPVSANKGYQEGAFG